MQYRHLFFINSQEEGKKSVVCIHFQKRKENLVTAMNNGDYQMRVLVLFVPSQPFQVAFFFYLLFLYHVWHGRH